MGIGPYGRGKAGGRKGSPYIGKELHMKQKRKCRNCLWELVNEPEVLQGWLVENLGAEMSYHWAVRDEYGREEPRVLHPVQYEHWLEKGPCVGCPVAFGCKKVCALRARWWDARMDRLRRKLGVRMAGGQ